VICVMADPDKITEKTLINQGEAETLRNIKIISQPHDHDQHPLSLFQEHIDAADLMSDLSIDEFKKHREAHLRSVTEAARNLIMKRLPEMQDKVLVTAYKIMSDDLARIQGDPTQRIEVTKKGLTPDQLEELYKKLPVSVESEELTDGTKQGPGKSSKRLASNARNTNKGTKGDSKSV
jgi:hypothetical protein